METTLTVSKCKDEIAEEVEKLFLEFLYRFQDVNDLEPHYKEPIKRLRSCERNTLFVDFSHILLFNSEFANNVQLHFHRLYPSLCRALRTAAIEYCKEDVDISRFHYKEFYVSICGVGDRARLRELGTNIIGVLVCISGQVVRTHPVHPELYKGSFLCDVCSTVTRDIEQQFRYTQPVRCSNTQCQNRTKFDLVIEESNFIDFQKVRIQETQSEIPRGAIPLSLDVIVRGELVETVQPGDRCDFVGTLIVIPDVSQLSAPGMKAEMSTKSHGGRSGENEGLTGLKALGVRDLSYKMAFLACNVCQLGQSNTRATGKREETDPEMLWEQMDAKEKFVLKKMSNDKDIAANLVNSLFPEIYGHDEVKLGVLLMLFGGITKTCPGEGTKLRGDINICLIGDPSTAKSQILKIVEHFSPRAVYTSGKASSAAGLTAAVVKDEESFEFVIEAGALMLADNGVCCIDEFDKMDIRDQIAIHEAMEQQTISITKAGVKATLNARASILAAANPVGGRYDRSRPLKYNIQLSAPIMSRFDLFFVMVDRCNEAVDYAIAKRIIQNHKNRFRNEAFSTVYEFNDIQKYIAFARCFRPKMSEEAKQLLVSAYKRLRMEDSNNSATSSWRITVRQLESLIRLSEALARLHCDDWVREDHVRQSFQLLSKSIIRVDQPDIALDEHEELVKVNMDVDEERAEENLASRRILGERNLDDSVERISQTLDSYQIAQDKPSDGAPPAVINIKFETYKKIADMLVLHIRRDEEQQIENENWQGVPESQLIQWYLDMIEDTLETEQDLITQRTICRRIVKRLIYEDQILIHTNAEEPDSEPTLVVHPNYVVSED